MDPNDEPEVYDPKTNPNPPTPAPHDFEHKYFGHFVIPERQGQEFEGEVYAPYGLHKGLPIQGPPDMDQIWLFREDLREGSDINFIGEDWKNEAPREKGCLWEYQRPHLESHLIKDVTFVKPLGEGGYGVVWEVTAQHRADVMQKWPDQIAKECGEKEVEKRSFALKVFSSEGFDYSWRQSFEESLNEMRLLRYLRHENICNIKEIIGIPDRKTGFPYAKVCLFLELCSGSLLNILNEGNIPHVSLPDGNKRVLPEDLSRHWFRDVLRGLEYLHRNDIVHRDINENNILYLSEGTTSGADYQERFLKSTFKLADFGLSRTEDYYIQKSKHHQYQGYKYGDVLELFGLLLDYGVPDCKGEPFYEKGILPKNFAAYCKTQKWKEKYPIEWKNISPELLDLVHFSISQRETMNALDVWNHPWLQKGSYSNFSSVEVTPKDLPQIPETLGEKSSFEYPPEMPQTFWGRLGWGETKPRRRSV